MTGLCGANCRHNFGPYFEGMENPFEHYDSEENKKAYEIQQRQRTLERRIRDTKRDVMARKTAVDNCKDEKLKFALDMDYQKKAALLAKQNKAYNDFCEQNDLKRLADRIAVARFDRQQAAAARGAAKRYESAKGNTTIPKAEPKPKKPETIAEINEKATDSLLNAYDSRREHFGLNLTPADELRTSSLNPITANYEGVSVDTANSFNDTITKLSKEYYTGFTKIEVMDKKQSFGAQMFATTTHNNSVGQKALLLNPHNTGNFEQLTSRIRELSDNGYAVRIAKGREAEYIPTHEFGHSLMDMKSPLKNFIGMDTKMLSKARKEIDAVYNEYVKEIGDLETRVKTAEGKAIFATDQKEFDALRKEISQIKEQLSRKRISKYSLANSDEFLAECFTDCRIGANPSDYSKRVGAILDVYFKK